MDARELEITAELEVCRALQKLCRALRSNRARPELAGPAGRQELHLNERIAELEGQLTPELRKVAA